jgi:HD-GYP domain-containing protein (c-di-GMP phosphodiesterase class II)
MELEERKVDVEELAIGMFVYRLDRPWTDTPFPIQGFVVETIDEISILRSYCRHVFIDVIRTRVHERVAYAVRDGRAVGDVPSGGYGGAHAGPPPAKVTLEPRNSPLFIDLGDRAPRYRYHDTVTMVEELPRAREAHANATMLANKIIDDVRAGRVLAVKDVEQAVLPVVQSVVRNADAFFWIASQRRLDAYAYSHAINCAVIAAAFGRHMGFSEDILINLASGGLLMDVGKSELSEELLSNPEGLDPEQTRQMQKHVDIGVRLLDGVGLLNEDVRQMVVTHHERFDGSGYPSGLKENQIPLFGRMAGIIDTYSAMTSDRAHRKAQPPHVALQQLYRVRDQLFQAEVVEQFLQCLGIYPTGSLVELSSGEVAIVMAQNLSRRLRPRVMVLMSPDKKLYQQFMEIDLMSDQLAEEGRRRVEIMGTLEPGAFGIDPRELYLG